MPVVIFFLSMISFANCFTSYFIHFNPGMVTINNTRHTIYHKALQQNEMIHLIWSIWYGPYDMGHIIWLIIYSPYWSNHCSQTNWIIWEHLKLFSLSFQDKQLQFGKWEPINLHGSHSTIFQKVWIQITSFTIQYGPYSICKIFIQRSDAESFEVTKRHENDRPRPLSEFNFDFLWFSITKWYKNVRKI